MATGRNGNAYGWRNGRMWQDVELSDNSSRLSDIPPLLRETPRPKKAVPRAAFCQTNEVSNINH